MVVVVAAAAMMMMMEIMMWWWCQGREKRGRRRRLRRRGRETKDHHGTQEEVASTAKQWVEFSRKEGEKEEDQTEATPPELSIGDAVTALNQLKRVKNSVTRTAVRKQYEEMMNSLCEVKKVEIHEICYHVLKTLLISKLCISAFCLLASQFVAVKIDDLSPKQVAIVLNAAVTAITRKLVDCVTVLSWQIGYKSSKKLFKAASRHVVKMHDDPIRNFVFTEQSIAMILNAFTRAQQSDIHKRATQCLIAVIMDDRKRSDRSKRKYSSSSTRPRRLGSTGSARSTGRIGSMGQSSSFE
eukprot:761707-Hanusia_phi.AAC.1